MRRRNYFRGPHQIKNTVGTCPHCAPPSVPPPVVPSSLLFQILVPKIFDLFDSLSVITHSKIAPQVFHNTTYFSRFPPKIKSHSLK